MATFDESRTAPVRIGLVTGEMVSVFGDLYGPDVNLAARYFALPSEFVNGPGDEVSIHTEAEARAANRALPCGAVLISVDQRGRFASALFRLTNRKGPDGGCGSGAGQLARTNFVIAGGHIVEWIRAPSVSGGGRSQGQPAPPATPSGGPVV